MPNSSNKCGQKRRVVKPGLKALPDVEVPAHVASEWCEVQA